MVEPEVQIRVGFRDDLAFIADSWAKCSHQIYPAEFEVDFFPKKQAQISAVLDNPASTILVAALDGLPKEILSYIVFCFVGRIFVIQYGYTRSDLRRKHIFDQLVQFGNPQKFPVVFTAPPRNENVMRGLSKKWIFDPTMRIA